MIYFIRHAESIYNAVQKEIIDELGQNYLYSEKHLTEKFSRKYLDVDITENGVLQCQNARKLLENQKFDIILVSPLKRALRTCSIIFEKHQTPIIVEPAFREIMESSNDIGTLNEESRIKYSTFNFDNIKDKETWYVHTLQQKDKENVLQILKGLQGEQRIQKTIEQCLKIAQQNWIDRKNYPQKEFELKERIMPSYEQQKAIIKEYLKKYNKIAIVAHSQCISKYAGLIIDNCEIYPFDAKNM